MSRTKPSPEPLEQRIAPANLAFAVTAGGSQQQFIDDIAVDPSGNTYVAGRFQGLVDFDPGPGVVSRLALAGDTDGFVAKYDGLGELAWVAVVRDSDRTTTPMKIAVSSLGEAFVLGNFGTADGSGAISVADRLGTLGIFTNQIGPPQDIFVAKLDTLGAAQWVTRYGSVNSAAAEAGDIAVNAAGGIYLTGRAIAGTTAGSLSFDAQSVSVEANESDLFVVRLQDGITPSVTWVNDSTSPGVALQVDGLSISVNSLGSVAVRAETSAAATFSTPAPTTVPAGIVVGALDPAGAWEWVNGWAGTSDSTGSAVINEQGAVWVLGDFTGTIDVDPGPSLNSIVSAGLEDVYAVKLDSGGAFVFAKQFGNAASNRAGNLLALSGDGNVFFSVGIGAGTLDADPDASVLNLAGTAALISLSDVGTIRAEAVSQAPRLAKQESFAIDPAGGIHRAGAFDTAFNVGLDGEVKTLTSKGSTDFFIARYLPGNSLAQGLQSPVLDGRFTIGGAGSQTGGPVVTDSAGNLYAAGTFTGTVDFDPGLTVSNLTSTDPDGNIYIAKYDALGALVWARSVQMGLTFNNAAPDLRIHLELDAAGNAYLASEYDVVATFGTISLTNSDPIEASSARDIFVTKLNPDGAFQWARSLGAAGQSDFVEALSVNPTNGEIAIGGEFRGTIDFDPSASVQNRTATNGSVGADGYVLQLDTDGIFRWLRQIGGAAARAHVDSLAYLSTGDLVATGEFAGTVDFALGGAALTLSSQSTLPNGRDAFATRLATGDGAAVWRAGFGGASRAMGTSVAITPADEVFIAGVFNGTADFDPSASVATLIEAGGDASGNSPGDIFLLGLDLNGSFGSAVSIGGAGAERTMQLELGEPTVLYLVGKMGPSLDLDPTAGVARLSSTTPDDLFVARYRTESFDLLSGYRLPAFIPDSASGANRGFDVTAGGGFSVDDTGRTFVSGTFLGALDLDPSGTLAPAVSKGGRDVLLARFLPANAFDAQHPRTFRDANGDLLTITLTGPGSATYTLAGNVGDFADLDTLSLTGTDLSSKVTVTATRAGAGDGASSVAKILTTGVNQHLGTITLGPQITLGDGLADTAVDVQVTGALKGLKLRELAANTIIRLGEDLPYDDPNPLVPDTKNHFPSFAIGNVLGAGVQLVVLGKDAPLDGPTAGQGTAQGVGGGGLGHLIVGSWAFPGFIRTTQSIGNLNVVTGDFYCVLEIDKYRVGSTTEANVGEMTIQEGSWGSSGSEIEGNIEAFDAEAFLAGASITAASIGAVGTTEGSFDGTLILTDPDSSAVPVFTVTTDFTGSVVSAASIKRLIIKGDFTGELQAPSIGSITAYAFLGTTDMMGVPTTQIEATQGALGTITATAGVVKDYEIVTDQAFKGFKVRLTNLTSDTVGIDNVHIAAASIGNITVSLAAKAKEAAGVDLTGIRNSTFTTTATGTTRTTAGTIGNISVTLTGGVGGGSGNGLEDVTFNALVGDLMTPDSTINSIGTIAVRITGQDGATVGLDNVNLTANSIGTTRVTVNRGTSLSATATAMNSVAYTATGAIGGLTIGGNATTTMVQALDVWAGRNVGAIAVKSLVPEHGSLADSAILAGQSLSLNGTTAAEQTTKLSLAKLGAVTVSGSLTNTDLVAGGSIGAVSVGRDMSGARVLAGAMLGGDFAIDGDESYQRAAAIAAVTVKGAFAQSSIAAGVSPGDSIFGNGDDTTAAAVALLTNTSSIGAISLATGVSGAPISMPLHAIEAAKIASLKVGGVAITTLPAYLDLGAAGEDAADVVVRLV